MRTRWTLLSAIVVSGLGWSTNHVFCQDAGGGKKAEAPARAAPTPEEMKAWMESMTPGEPHKKFEMQAGNYTVKGRTWMDSKAQPVELNGTASIKMILGGRYQVREFKGDSMGMPYEGTGIAGYDNVAKEYFSTWVDNMRTGIIHYRGKADDRGVVTMTCEMDDPMDPTVKRKSREVTKFTDADHFTTETWMKDKRHAEEFKAAEMAYTRKK